VIESNFIASKFILSEVQGSVLGHTLKQSLPLQVVVESNLGLNLSGFASGSHVPSNSFNDGGLVVYEIVSESVTLLHSVLISLACSKVHRCWTLPLLVVLYHVEASSIVVVQN
jgi:hypothetical protein